MESSYAGGGTLAVFLAFALWVIIAGIPVVIGVLFAVFQRRNKERLASPRSTAPSEAVPMGRRSLDRPQKRRDEKKRAS